MTKILICFDGTGNEPEDAEQEKNKGGKLEDDNISNVLKLHLFAGGSLDNTATHVEGQHSLYYAGVGVRGGFFRRIVRQVFAGKAPEVIIDEAFNDLEKIYKKTDRLFIFGFSRGAAIARLFASRLAKEGLQTCTGLLDRAPVVQMLGVWDTVAAMGKANFKIRSRPISDVLFENGTISPIIRNAYHLLAVDENRRAFRPTLMNRQPNVTQIWFPGVHSDIGGGYRLDGLSDVTLEYMLDKARQHLLDFLDVDEIPEAVLHGGKDHEGDDVDIDRDDIRIEPDILGKLHVHDQEWRNAVLLRRTIAARDIIVVHNDVESGDPPLLHHSVVTRIKKDSDYRPDNLVDIPHRVLGENGMIEEFKGLEEHEPKKA